MNHILQGAYDLHIHVAPDVIQRKCNDLELAEKVRDAGMKGCVIKCHYFETAARAALLRSQVPELEIAGGLALNLSVGGINPYAVERFGQMGGGILWFPTMDARAFQTYKHKEDPDFDGSSYLVATDGQGTLLPETAEVLKLAEKYHMVVATGHLSPEEGLCILREARCLGVEHTIVTHVEHPAMQYTDEQQLEAVRLGAMIEHSYNNAWFGRCTLLEIVRQIRVVGCEHVIMSTDFGQVNAPFSVDGLREYAEKLKEYGFSDDELHTMLCRNPGAVLSGIVKKEVI